jgi:hypothetical protein
MLKFSSFHFFSFFFFQRIKSQDIEDLRRQIVISDKYLIGVFLKMYYSKKNEENTHFS